MIVAPLSFLQTNVALTFLFFLYYHEREEEEEETSTWSHVALPCSTCDCDGMILIARALKGFRTMMSCGVWGASVCTTDSLLVLLIGWVGELTTQYVIVMFMKLMFPGKLSFSYHPTTFNVVLIIIATCRVQSIWSTCSCVQIEAVGSMRFYFLNHLFSLHTRVLLSLYT